MDASDIRNIAGAPYGLTYTNRKSLSDLMTKNNFTTEAPLIFALYMDGEMHRGPVYIQARQDASAPSGISTFQQEVPLQQVLGVAPNDAFYSFETSFDGYQKYAIGEANRSDLVVINRNTGKHVSAFEIKLCVVPNSGTANRPHDEQSCEIVVRPPSIEQLAFSIADTYSDAGRQELQDLIVQELGGNVQGYKWNDQTFMFDHLTNIRSAVRAISLAKIDQQRPFAMTGIWRTIGQSEEFDENSFDTFVWSNLAFLQLLGCQDDDASAKKKQNKKNNHEITRPERSLIWLVKVLLDYSLQKKVDFDKTHRDITFHAQTDKAGAFSGDAPYAFMKGERFFRPLITKASIVDMISDACIAMMKPERRLDATLMHLSFETTHTSKKDKDI